ncbi:putative secreted protein (Por secretion system target) [Kordia periserrulae]|uniref:Putative secreted protein (Por secretion system target) n=1 Tax=Kordia periserrulae TaxID=701523 RepID=A0A2T6BUH9_9FLAO|nr:T9SS type A sorting domain-containing protein [Kordia periserrulae]PTX59696.1 putative secreted protein (Por secretion system target) [Kordia periserrulae]
MKKNYFSLLLLLCATFTMAQNNDFTNGGGDFLWSNTANWSLSVIPNTTNTGQVRLPLTVESLVDVDVTVKKIQTTFATSGDAPVAGNATLTIDAGANAVFGIENVSDNDINIIFRGNVTINNTTTSGIQNTLMRNQNGNTNDVNGIIFDSGSVLTLNTPLEARAGSGGDVYNFNGSLAGTNALRVSANTISNFGSTSDNSSFGGDFVWVGTNASMVVNTADNGVFLPVDRKVQINGSNGSIEVNGENVFQGNISINGSNSFLFNPTKNQNAMGTITFAGGAADGVLNIDVPGTVTTLAFADNSASDWGSGTVNITGYQEGVFRFGTDNNGLTPAQLAQITVDGSGGAIALDSSGFLINASSLSTEDFELNSKPIAYPTLASNTIFFSKPQENVKVFDLNGRMILQNQSENQVQIDVNSLARGMYLIIFDNKKTEKFIKQ